MKRKINHYLIIDGYNIINAWDDLKKIAQIFKKGLFKYNILWYNAYRKKYKLAKRYIFWKE